MTNVKFDSGRASREGCFFSDPHRAAHLGVEAHSWDKTPFREWSKAKGPGGGIDCVGLCEEIMLAVGAAPAFTFPRAEGDYQSHTIEEKILGYLRGHDKEGNPIDDPQSAILTARFAEVEVPEFEGNPPPDFFMPGDLVLLRQGNPEGTGGLFHMPIMVYGRRFINCLPRIGVTWGTMQDSTFNRHFIAMFRARSLPSS
jgi:cell wall-associated NlpC family hydrolase